jgi:hypothetical protein
MVGGACASSGRRRRPPCFRLGVFPYGRAAASRGKEGRAGAVGFFATVYSCVGGKERLERRRRREQKLLFHVIQVRVEQGEKGDFGDGKLEKTAIPVSPMFACTLANRTRCVLVF